MLTDDNGINIVLTALGLDCFVDAPVFFEVLNGVEDSLVSNGEVLRSFLGHYPDVDWDELARVNHLFHQRIDR